MPHSSNGTGVRKMASATMATDTKRFCRPRADRQGPSVNMMMTELPLRTKTTATRASLTSCFGQVGQNVSCGNKREEKTYVLVAVVQVGQSRVADGDETESKHGESDGEDQPV